MPRSITARCYAILALSAAVFVLGGCRGSGRSVQPSPVSTPEPLEAKLALVDGHAHDELVVNRFRSLLGQLDASYVESPEQIGDMTVRAQQLLRDQGVAVSLLDLMEGMNRALPTAVPNQTYAEYVALYVTLRQKGQSHEEAVAGLHDVVAALVR